jgi:hypothetical protein
MARYCSPQFSVRTRSSPPYRATIRPKSSKAETPSTERKASCRCSQEPPRKISKECSEFKSWTPRFAPRPAESVAFSASTSQLTGQLCLRFGNYQKRHDLLSNACGGYISDFQRTFLRCHGGRDIGEITFGRATSTDELSLPLGSTGKSRSTPMSTKYQSCGSLFTCSSAGSAQQPFDRRS